MKLKKLFGISFITVLISFLSIGTVFGATGDYTPKNNTRGIPKAEAPGLIELNRFTDSQTLSWLRGYGFTNSTGHNDEQDFLTARTNFETFPNVAATGVPDTAKYKHVLNNLSEGDTVRVFVYIHNNGTQGENGKTAQNVQVSLDWSTLAQTEARISASNLQADNVTSVSDGSRRYVSDKVTLNATSGLTLQFENAFYQNIGGTSTTISPSINGTSLSVNLLPLPACFDFVRGVYFDFEVVKSEDVTVWKSATPPGCDSTAEAQTSNICTVGRPGEVGAEYVYNLHVKNNSNQALSSFVFTDVLDEKIEYVHEPTHYPGVIQNANGSLTITFSEPIPAGQERRKSFKVKVKNTAGDGDIIENNATGHGTWENGQPTPEIETETIYHRVDGVVAPDFEIYKSAVPAPCSTRAQAIANPELCDVARNQRYIYHVTVINKESVPLDNVVLFDELDPYISYVASAEYPNVSAIEGTNSIKIDFKAEYGVLQPNDERTMSFIVAVKNEAQDGYVIENFATGRGEHNGKVYPPEPTNKTYHIIEDGIITDGQFKISKSATPPSCSESGINETICRVARGQIYTYHLRVENTGSTDLTNVILTDELDPLLDFVEEGSDDGVSSTETSTAGNEIIKIDFGTVPAGEHRTKNFQVQVKENAPEPYKWIYNVATGEGKRGNQKVVPLHPTNRTRHYIRGNALDDFIIIKDANPVSGTNVQRNQTYIYILKVDNNTGATLNNVILFDNLDPAITYADNKSEIQVLGTDAGGRTMLKISFGDVPAGNDPENNKVEFKVTVKNDEALAPNGYTIENMATGQATQNGQPVAPTKPTETTYHTINGSTTGAKCHDSTGNGVYDMCSADGTGPECTTDTFATDCLTTPGCNVAQQCIAGGTLGACPNGNSDCTSGGSVPNYHTAPGCVIDGLTGELICSRVHIAAECHDNPFECDPLVEAAGYIPCDSDTDCYEELKKEILNPFMDYCTIDTCPGCFQGIQSITKKVKDSDSAIYDNWVSEITVSKEETVHYKITLELGTFKNIGPNGESYHIDSGELRVYDFTVPSQSGGLWKRAGLPSIWEESAADGNVLSLNLNNCTDLNYNQSCLTVLNNVNQYPNGVKIELEYTMDTTLQLAEDKTDYIKNLAFAVVDYQYSINGVPNVNSAYLCLDTTEDDPMTIAVESDPFDPNNFDLYGIFNFDTDSSEYSGSTLGDTAGVKILRPQLAIQGGGSKAVRVSTSQFEKLFGQRDSAADTFTRSGEDTHMTDAAEVELKNLTQYTGEHVDLARVKASATEEVASNPFGLSATVTMNKNGIYLVKGPATIDDSNALNSIDDEIRPKTFIFENGLTINEDFTLEKPMAFIIENGDLKIKTSVTHFEGIYIVQKGDIKATPDENSYQQLTIKGSLLGNERDLFSHRKYIGKTFDDAGKLVIEPAITITMYNLEPSNRPPLLESAKGTEWTQDN